VSSRRVRATVATLTALVSAFAAASPASAAPTPFYGVVTQGLFTGEDHELMSRAGVQSLRLQLGWPVVQERDGPCQAATQTGVCDWTRYDAIVGDAAAHGIRAFPYLLNVPSYIADDPDTPPVRSATAREAWTGFVEAAVERYGPGGAYWSTVYPVDHPGAEPVPIEQWQVWNEPSAAPFWHPEPKPREYGKLVKLTSKAITGVDPDAYVVLGGLFGTPVEELGGIIQPEFLRALYRTPKIERFFDAAAIHPYGPDLKRVRFQVDWARDELKRADDRQADLWISEIGWASDRVHNQLGVGRKGQARMLTKTFRLFRSKRRRWNIAGVDWYAWQDTDSPEFCDFCRRSGLVDVNDQPKLSYDAFARQARR
jgi:hypothetical protein